MRNPSLILRLLLGLATLAAGVYAQPRSNVFVLPLSSSAAGTGQSFSADPFASNGTFAASPVASQVYTNGAGTQLYVVARSGSQTIQILDAANPTTVINSFNLGQNAQASLLTPDGRNLVVLTNRLNVLTTANNQLIQNFPNLDLGNNPSDLASSNDSRYVYVLSPDSLRLTSVDINAGSIVATQTFASRPSSVAVAPNGFVYVTSLNAVYELDPVTLTVRATITVNGTPGKLQFSPDGRYAAAVNTQPQTGSLLFDIDLLGRTVIGTIPQISGLNEQLNSLVVVSNTRAFATSITGTLYDISLSPLGIAPAAFSNVSSIPNVTAVAATNELPQAHYLFVGTNSGLYRVDLTSSGSSATGPLALSFPAGAIVYAPAASTATPATLQLFNNNQAISVGQNFLPIVVRALDAQGRPVANAAVSFSSLTPGIAITNATAFTNLQGFAQATVVAPNLATTVAIAVSVGAPGASAQFTLAVGTSVPGGGPTGTSTISLYQGLSPDGTFVLNGGQGQLLEDTRPAAAVNPLAVQVKDNQGNPLPNQSVIFTLTGSGGSSGALQPFQGSACTVSNNTASCTTDANGVTYVGYQPAPVSAATAYPQDTITATANGATLTFYETAFNGRVATSRPSVVPDQTISPPFTTISVQAGQVKPGAIVIRVGNGIGQPLPNVGVFLTRRDPDTLAPIVTTTGPTAICVGGTVLTDASGKAVCDLVASGVGTATITAVVGGGIANYDYILNVTPAAASKITAVQGDVQTVNAGAQLPTNLTVQVTDASGNPLSGQNVTFTVVTANSATVSPTATTTDASGRASTRVTAGNIPGTFQIRATSGALTTTFNFTVNASATQLLAFGGTPQTTQVGQPFGQPLTVLLRDLSNNAVPNATVNFTVTSGLATLSSNTATTNAQGQATINVTAGQTAGPVVVTATYGNLSTTFPLTVIPAGPQVTVASFANGASFQNGAITPGGITTITAPGLAPGVPGVVQPTNLVGQLPYTLAGTSVTVNNIPAPIFSVVNLNGVEQITIQVPFETLVGSATVIINTANGGTTTITGVPVVPYQPGIFETIDGNNNRYAVAVRGTDGSYMTPSNPLRRGENGTIFLTGLGTTTPATGTNRRGQPNQNVQALVVVALESTGIPFVSAKLLENEIGVYAVTFTVPLDAPTGPVKIGVTAYTPGTTVNGTNSFSSIVYIQ